MGKLVWGMWELTFNNSVNAILFPKFILKL